MLVPWNSGSSIAFDLHGLWSWERQHIVVNLQHAHATHYKPFENGEPRDDVAYEHMQIGENTDTESDATILLSRETLRNRCSAWLTHFYEILSFSLLTLTQRMRLPPFSCLSMGYDGEIQGLVLSCIAIHIYIVHNNGASIHTSSHDFYTHSFVYLFISYI